MITERPVANYLGLRVMLRKPAEWLDLNPYIVQNVQIERGLSAPMVGSNNAVGTLNVVLLDMPDELHERLDQGAAIEYVEIATGEPIFTGSVETIEDTTGGAKTNPLFYTSITAVDEVANLSNTTRNGMIRDAERQMYLGNVFTELTGFEVEFTAWPAYDQTYPYMEDEAAGIYDAPEYWTPQPHTIVLPDDSGDGVILEPKTDQSIEVFGYLEWKRTLKGFSKGDFYRVVLSTQGAVDVNDVLIGVGDIPPEAGEWYYHGPNISFMATGDLVPLTVHTQDYIRDLEIREFEIETVGFRYRDGWGATLANRTIQQVSYATYLDQAANSYPNLIWLIDRSGRFRVSHLEETPGWKFSDEAGENALGYTDFTVTRSGLNIINHVTLNHIYIEGAIAPPEYTGANRSGSSSSYETVWEDTDSQAEYGIRSARIDTLAGESAAAEALAKSLMRTTPGRDLTAVSFNAAQFYGRPRNPGAEIEIGDFIALTNKGKTFTGFVSRIRHRITAERWMVDLEIRPNTTPRTAEQ